MNIKKNKAKKNLDYNAILEGCVFPDENRDYWGYGSSKWHGKGKYYGIVGQQMGTAVSEWKKGNYKKACKELGKGLHTLQDHQAHTVVLNGVRVNAKEVGGGKYSFENMSAKNGCMLKYFNLINKKDGMYIGYEKALDIKHMHKITADNVNADFIAGKWVFKVGKSDRYNTSISDSVEYFNNFAKALNN